MQFAQFLLYINNAIAQDFIKINAENTRVKAILDIIYNGSIRYGYNVAINMACVCMGISVQIC